MNDIALELFASEYARHRAQEGRGYSGEQLFQLPHLKTGPHIAQWAVRARTFEAFMKCVLRPTAMKEGRALAVLDLGAGNGWLSYRVALEGHHAFALDIRTDGVDGLGASAPLRRQAPGMDCIVAPFEAVPLPPGTIDVALFNASLHYATNLRQVLCEAIRVTRRGGHIAILDSPFYARESDGLAMVSEKRRRFGASAEVLMGLPFIEFLTRERLKDAAPELAWKRHRVTYPLVYELRPLLAALTFKRRPSRFDLWIAAVP